MNKIVLLLFISLVVFRANSQTLCGSYTIGGSNPNYTTVADAISDLNTMTICGPVIFEVAAGQIFIEPQLTITATGTFVNTITFRKNGTGTNPVIRTLGTSATTDFVIKLAGSDYVTFNGVDIEQTGTTSSDFVEYGIFLSGASATNGCQNNTFKNLQINLNGSIANTSSRAVNSAVSSPSTIAGANSFNRFYNVRIKSSFTGYYLSGSTTTGVEDVGNEISTEGNDSSIVENLGTLNTIGTLYGGYLLGQKNAVVSNTTFRNINNNSTTYGLYVSPGTGNNATIINNVITNSTNASTGAFYATYLNSGRIRFANNIISNITNTSTGAMYGSYVNGGDTINIINNKYLNIRTLGTTTYVIYLYSGSTTFQNVYNNIINDVRSTSSGAAIIQGIRSSLGGMNIIYNNMISNLRASTSSSGTAVAGLAVTGGTAGTTVKFYNNTILLEDTSTGNLAYANAGIYISSTTPTIDLQNNIIVNKSVLTLGTRVSAIHNTSTTLNYDMNSNNNLLYAGTPGNANLIYYASSTAYQTLASYKAISGMSPRETNTVTENTSFLNINNGVIRINPLVPSLVESGAKINSAVTIDFENNLRGPYPLSGQINGGGASPDIGADEYDGMFTDINPPVIAYTPLQNSVNLSSATLVATITDDKSGIDTINKPRCYYKRTTGINVFAGNTSNDNGWKYVVASNSSSPFVFNLNYSILFGGLPNYGDTIQYFVVAQDGFSTPNVAINSGSFTTQAASVNLAGTNFPITGTINKFNLTTPIMGNKNIPTDYPNLTGVGGLFDAINNAVVGGNINVSISTNIVEPGTITLYSFSPEYKLTIRPDGPNMRTISATNASSGLIKLSGVSGLVIDGRNPFTLTGNYLTIRNMSTTAPTILFSNDCKRDTIRNCTIEGANTAAGSGVVMIGNGSAFGNDSLYFYQNIIRDSAGVNAFIPANLLFSNGISGANNDNNNIIQNTFVNFTANAVLISSIGNGDSWNISENTIYQTGIRAANITGINIQTGNNGGGHIVNSNNIGGSNLLRTGNAWSTTQAFMGISIIGSSKQSVITKNNISNLYSSSQGALNYGIYCNGGTVLVGGSTAQDANIVGTSYDSICAANSVHGIGINAGIVRVENNQIEGIVYMDADFERAVGIYVLSASTDTILNNTIKNIRHYSNHTSGSYTTGFAPAGIFITAGSNHLVQGNTIYNIGANPTTSPYPVFGIKYANATNSVINSNRVYAVTNQGTGTGTNGPAVVGIHAASGTATYSNNQVFIGSEVGNDAQVYGILDMGTGVNNYINNTVLLSGVGNGANNTYSFYRYSTSVVTAINNIFFNKRTNMGMGISFALGSVPTTGISPANLNNNLLVVNDTMKLADVPVGMPNGVSAFNSLYISNNTYNTNWIESTQNLSAFDLFTDTLTGNLGIKNTNPQSWYVNGKGIALGGLSKDFNNQNRSTTIAGGTTDIGSVEFNTLTLPPLATASAAPASLTSTFYYFANRKLGQINWASSGVVPTSVNIRYFSGVNAPNLLPSKTQFNSYFDISAVGGSAYTFDLSLMYDSTYLGNVSASTNARIARYNNSSWNLITSSTNANIGFMNGANMLSAFGIFTGTDQNNPLPVKLLSLTAVKMSSDVIVNWSTASEINNKGFEVERGFDNKEFESIAFIKGKGNSNKIANYAFVDENIFVNASSKDIYYRLKQIDFDGNLCYSNSVLVSNENNNEFELLSIYPNPFNQNLTIQSVDSFTSLKLYDIRGIVVYSTGIVGNSVNINTENLREGVYFLKLEGIDKVIKLVKTVK